MTHLPEDQITVTLTPVELAFVIYGVTKVGMENAIALSEDLTPEHQVIYTDNDTLLRDLHNRLVDEFDLATL